MRPVKLAIAAAVAAVVTLIGVNAADAVATPSHSTGAAHASPQDLFSSWW